MLGLNDIILTTLINIITLSMNIGKLIQQPGGYKAFIPEKFPPDKKIIINTRTQQLHARAVLMLGKLDGITQLLPDLDFFILMYIRKEAAKSSEIEGTKATIIDVIKKESTLEYRFPQDVDRIVHYIKAMEYGLERLKTLPLSLRFIREIHKILLEDTADAPGKTPGEFRQSQNWIGGNSLNTATFIPPPPSELYRCLDDLEKFIYSKNDYTPLIKAALVHAQFETIHPFLDGNGRTGRLLTTFYLCKLGMLEKPVLYLSDYFLKNRKQYYDCLSGYHIENSDINSWLDFFLNGVAVIAEEAIDVSKKINSLRINDLKKIQTLGKRAKKAILVLEKLYNLPIITVKKIEEWTGLSRPQANELTKKMVELGILEQIDKKIGYRRQFWYKNYLDLFMEK
jgi:Fic family protein